MSVIDQYSVKKWFCSDKEFNALYPTAIQALAKYHWTPLAIAQEAARFLAGDGGGSVLDIGSGVGKFCLAGAYYNPSVSFYGVEQRRGLVAHAEAAKDLLRLKNVSFIHGNFTQLDLKRYDHFYFYNAFYENLDCSDKIDDSIDYSGELYDYYTRYLFRQFQQKPKGTRLCTLCSLESEVPPDFQVVHSDMSDSLKFWIKL